MRTGATGAEGMDVGAEGGGGGEVGISVQTGWSEEAARDAALSRQDRTMFTGVFGMRKSRGTGSTKGVT